MKISIITATYNSAHTLADTLECVEKQDHPDIEHIIIDGGSSDETISIIKRFTHIKKFVSEKDNGIYDAMNKGIAIAGGDIIGILNSDDIYAFPGALSLVAGTFQQNPEAKAVYADLQFVQRNDISKVVRSWKAGRYKKNSFYYGWMPPHPTFFVKKEVYEKLGAFNTTLGSAADYELMLRVLLKNNIKPAYINKVIIKMRMGGISTSSIKNRIKANLQDRLAWKVNQLTPFPFTTYLKPARKLGQFFLK